MVNMKVGRHIEILRLRVNNIKSYFKPIAYEKVGIVPH